MPSAEIKRHWDRVAQIPCMVCGNPNVTLHHAHGGSMKLRQVHRSAGRKNSDWLVIPLCALHHVGDEGIDNGLRYSVVRWESTYGTQAEMLDLICIITGVDVWSKSNVFARS